MSNLAIEKMPTQVTLRFVAGDSLRFRVRVMQKADGWTEDNPVMEPRDLTGWTASAHIKDKAATVNPLSVFTFNELDETGIIDAYLSPDESNHLRGLLSGVWDLSIKNADESDKDTIFAGPAKPKGDVTRD